MSGADVAGTVARVIPPASTLPCHAGSLDRPVVQRLYDKTREVLQTAIDCEADPALMPESFLLRHRHKNGHCPHCGGRVAQDRIAGRTAYFCPACQKRG
ncbi:MAG: zinc finger domain-containing protein [Dehalococcoidia bacterium]